jgi:predicted 3-demethylubiquinone-9 3-methyltransferase (glyoxalase superfamily)
VLDPVRGRTFDIEVPLSAVPGAEQCGWCKDKFGLSWQIVPTVMDTMMAKGTRAQIDRLTQAFLPMKKLDIAALQKAYKGK